MVLGPYQPSAFRIFATALGLIESGNSRIRRSHAAMMSFSHLLDSLQILPGFLLRKNYVPHPDPQRGLFLWACRLVSAREGFNHGFFRAIHLRLLSAGFFLDFNASEGILLEDYSKPAIQSHNGFRSSSSNANPRMSLSSLMARRGFCISALPDGDSVHCGNL